MNIKVEVSFTKGSSITLKRVNENGTVDYVTCDDVMYVEDEYLDETFQDWLDCAIAGESGYSAVVDNGFTAVLY